VKDARVLRGDLLAEERVPVGARVETGVDLETVLDALDAEGRFHPEVHRQHDELERLRDRIRRAEVFRTAGDRVVDETADVKGRRAVGGGPRVHRQIAWHVSPVRRLIAGRIAEHEERHREAARLLRQRRERDHRGDAREMRVRKRRRRADVHG
jgi:hypothetical protein